MGGITVFFVFVGTLIALTVLIVLAVQQGQTIAIGIGLLSLVVGFLVGMILSSISKGEK